MQGDGVAVTVFNAMSKREERLLAPDQAVRTWQLLVVRRRRRAYPAMRPVDLGLLSCWPFPSNIHEDENLGLGTAACGSCLTQSDEIV